MAPARPAARGARCPRGRRYTFWNSTRSRAAKVGTLPADKPALLLGRQPKGPPGIAAPCTLVCPGRRPGLASTRIPAASATICGPVPCSPSAPMHHLRACHESRTTSTSQVRRHDIFHFLAQSFPPPRENRERSRTRTGRRPGRPRAPASPRGRKQDPLASPPVREERGERRYHVAGLAMGAGARDTSPARSESPGTRRRPGSGVGEGSACQGSNRLAKETAACGIITANR